MLLLKIVLVADENVFDEAAFTIQDHHFVVVQLLAAVAFEARVVAVVLVRFFQIRKHMVLKVLLVHPRFIDAFGYNPN